ncbi:sensor histidine kinase [Aliikangiella coralliicola]|uniref:histidine kinase n=1 Tax=Aliikangiella coralliicola TaxID=2592383 RepID=A0A545UIH7_9GAMM|nr:ATP-binding protein [Aliikangiella coralliicola]TQV89269.1 hypothetical protein FLL46_03825 [Aliikangiella coralliicola]
MNHYIKIFLSFALVNYILIFTYDNYYLSSLESNYLTESRDQLRQYSLDLRSELSSSSVARETNGDQSSESILKDKTSIINRWASQQNIPSQIWALEELQVDPDILSELNKSDYIIDLYSGMGPSAYVKIDEKQIVEIGPLDPLYMETTSYQPFFIFLIILVNGITAGIHFYLFRLKSKKIEYAISSLVERQHLSHEMLGVQDVLQIIAKKLIVLDNYIQDIEQTNHQIINDQRDLMHAVAHELRSPIARFSFALELVEDSNQSPEDSKLIKDMHDSIDELEALIKEILSYSRLSHGKMILNYEAVYPIDLITTITARLQSLYTQQEFCILNDLADIELVADRRLLERAFINLLRNAARFAKNRVNITLHGDEEQITVVIDDDGIGIPPGKRERIFEAFTRLDPSRSRDSGGVGLGLAIVKKIVEKHEGEVTVGDSPMGGARFSVSLPLTSKDE